MLPWNRPLFNRSARGLGTLDEPDLEGAQPKSIRIAAEEPNHAEVPHTGFESASDFVLKA